MIADADIIIIDVFRYELANIDTLRHSYALLMLMVTLILWLIQRYAAAAAAGFSRCFSPLTLRCLCRHVAIDTPLSLRYAGHY